MTEPIIGEVSCQETLNPAEPGVPSVASSPLTKIEPASELQFGLEIAKVGVIGGGWVIEKE